MPHNDETFELQVNFGPNPSYIIVEGTTGLSAYEIAVKNGYSGTEQEWIETYKSTEDYQELLLAANRAAEAENEAERSAYEAAKDAEEAEDSANTAEAARDAAILGGEGVFASTAAGISGTVNGQAFVVADSNGWSSYLNQNGTALSTSGLFPTLNSLEDSIANSVGANLVRDDRPGEQPVRYTTSVSGDRSTGDTPTGAITVDPSNLQYGKVFQFGPATTVALRDRVWIDRSQDTIMSVEAIFRVQTNTCDPQGELLQMGVAYLNANYEILKTEYMYNAVTWESDGWIKKEILLNAGGFLDNPIQYDPAVTGTVSTVPPPVVYAVPFVRSNGADGIYQVALLKASFKNTKVIAPNIIFPETFEFPSEVIPELTYTVARTFYVTMTGDDSNPGDNIKQPFRTINQGIAAMAAHPKVPNPNPPSPEFPLDDPSNLMAAPCVLIVHPGEYIVQPNTVLTQNCTVYGYDLRTTILQLPAGQEENNMFLVQNGTKIRGVTFKGLQHEAPDYWDSDVRPSTPANEADRYRAWLEDNENWTRNGPNVQAPNYVYIPGNAPEDAGKSYQRHEYLPKKGYAIAFDPGALITRSPYIADCSCLHSFTHFDDMLEPMDPTATPRPNPQMNRGQGNVYADGSVLHPSSPVRTIVCDSFTALNPNGVAYAVVADGFVQLVSIFTNWSRVGVWCHNGGHVTIANSNTSFGDYVFYATGYRNAVLAGEIQDPNAPWSPNANAASILAANRQKYIDAVYIGAVNAGFPDTPENEAICAKDSPFFVDAIYADVLKGNDNQSRFFYQKNFNWDGVCWLPDDTLAWVTAGWNEASVAMQLDLVAHLGSQQQVVELVNFMIDATLETTNGVPTPGGSLMNYFPSLVEATGQQLSYAGAGINYNAMPFNQGGTAVVPDPATVFLRTSGGRIYATFSTETGDTYLGQDLRIDYERSTIEGQAFSRGVQNIALPLIIGLGG